MKAVPKWKKDLRSQLTFKFVRDNPYKAGLIWGLQYYHWYYGELCLTTYPDEDPIHEYYTLEELEETVWYTMDEGDDFNSLVDNEEWSEKFYRGFMVHFSKVVGWTIADELFRFDEKHFYTKKERRETVRKALEYARKFRTYRHDKDALEEILADFSWSFIDTPRDIHGNIMEAFQIVPPNRIHNVADELYRLARDLANLYRTYEIEKPE